ncbi:threonine/serine exporter family protein [Mariniflexile litorale]|uniref:Threonine/serine exporter family protein n=1 Tax=Mariniflexile litorale TaxID=3045158 RepID=A0AAU7EF33_9FLAO|nr:threonine/serine exporter family protein [Mariniflexile sp. KMM 9835]MDQ8211590.1 threonine/serine exporter family protein [Mariniflexile sp. KMM 9835]
MMEIILKLLEVAAWSGVAAIGFGILFNIPKGTIITVFILGFTAGLIKFTLLKFNLNIVLSTFIAVLFVAVVSMPISHKIHHPPVVFCIPPVIPMIPGYFAYETVLSVMNFIFIEKDIVKRIALIDSIFYNGFTMFFILISITAGISLPMLLLRKSTVKKIDLA